MSKGSNDGFTLAETVIALAVVSLALSGILAATNLITRHSQQVAKATRIARAADLTVIRLNSELAQYQPFTTNLSGTSEGFNYDCGDRRCRFRLANATQKLVYVSQGNVLTEWPSKASTNGRQRILEALILQDRTGTTLGLVRLETEQSKDCQFDMISRACRGKGGKNKP